MAYRTSEVVEGKPLPLTTCPRCGAIVVNIKGSRLAVCSRCGAKDDCC